MLTTNECISYGEEHHACTDGPSCAFPTVDNTAKGATRDLNITMKTAVGIVDGVMDNVHALYPQVVDRLFLLLSTIELAAPTGCTGLAFWHEISDEISFSGGQLGDFDGKIR